MLILSFTSAADLREVLRRLHQKCGNFDQLIKDDPKTWKELVEPNVCYILHEVLQGLSYLRQNNIQHGDLKGWWTDLEWSLFHWGGAGSAQPGSTYYLQKASHDVSGPRLACIAY